MKKIDKYIIEKLHITKDSGQEYYVVILYYTKKPNCEYKVCDTVEKVIDAIYDNRSFNSVYKIYDLNNIDKLLKSRWDHTINDEEYLKSIHAEKYTDEIREILKNKVRHGR